MYRHIPLHASSQYCCAPQILQHCSLPLCMQQYVLDFHHGCLPLLRSSFFFFFLMSSTIFLVTSHLPRTSSLDSSGSWNAPAPCQEKPMSCSCVRLQALWPPAPDFVPGSALLCCLMMERVCCVAPIFYSTACNTADSNAYNPTQALCLTRSALHAVLPQHQSTKHCIPRLIPHANETCWAQGKRLSCRTTSMIQG